MRCSSSGLPVPKRDSDPLIAAHATGTTGQQSRSDGPLDQVSLEDFEGNDGTTWRYLSAAF